MERGKKIVRRRILAKRGTGVISRGGEKGRELQKKKAEIHLGRGEIGGGGGHEGPSSEGKNGGRTIRSPASKAMGKKGRVC